MKHQSISKMVKQSTQDYGQWKKDVRKTYLDLDVRKSSVDNFMNYVSKRYDKHNRTYIPFRLMWYLYDKKNWVEKENQHYWVAFIGKNGGEGKTTLAENCMSFLDETFTPDRKALDYESLIKLIKGTVGKTDYPAIMLDEPENKLHPMSKKGRELRDILGKIRQLNLFIGACANSLSDLPPFVFQRLSAVFYLNNKHRFWTYDSTKDRPKHTILEELKKGFTREGHGIFLNKKIVKRAFFKNQGFSKETIFDEGDYIKRKMKNLMGDINKYIGLTPAKTKRDDRNEKIYERWKGAGGKFTQNQIAKYEGLTRVQINNICSEYGKIVKSRQSKSI